MEKRISQIPTRIAVLGPESSGKTTLCDFLADEHSATVVPEYAREYLKNRGIEYTSEDVLNIAQKQFERNQNTKGDMVVCDTEMITCRIWFSEKFSGVPLLVDQLIEDQDFDVYLLCKPDIPWEVDPLRENPVDRARLFSLYLDLLEKVGAPYHIIEGSHSERKQMVESILSLSR